MKAKKPYAVLTVRGTMHFVTGELTREDVAAIVGWTQIQIWGRGIRGRHPQRGGFESIPSYTSNLQDAVRAYTGIEGAADYVFDQARLMGEELRLWDSRYLCEKLVEFIGRGKK